MNTVEESLEALYPLDPEKRVTVLYRNHRGDREWRSITPQGIWHGQNEWHPEPQYFLKVYCHVREAQRDFAMKDIILWGQTGEPV